MYRVYQTCLCAKETQTFKRSDGIEALVILDGNVEVLGTEGNQGPGSTVSVMGDMVLTALIPSRLSIIATE